MAAPVVATTGTWVDWVNNVAGSGLRHRIDPPGSVYAQLKKTNNGTFSVPVANAPDEMRRVPTLVLVGTWQIGPTNERATETWL